MDPMEERVEISRGALQGFKTAAFESARAEADRIAHQVIEDLKSQPPMGVFEDLAARHLWDEFCWEIQEGPFDDYLTDAWETQLRASIVSVLDNTPKHHLVFLTALARDADFDDSDDDILGYVSIDDVSKIISDLIGEKASSRHYLDLIGPNRSDAISCHIEGNGIVWSVISETDEATDIISGYVEDLINASADLSKLANELVDQFISGLSEYDENMALAKLLEGFQNEIRALLLTKDVLPSLEVMRFDLIAKLDE